VVAGSVRAGALADLIGACANTALAGLSLIGLLALVGRRSSELRACRMSVKVRS
jgi:hypothetical protein